MSKRNLGNTEEMHTFLAPNKMICNFNGQGYDDNPIKGIEKTELGFKYLTVYC